MSSPNYTIEKMLWNNKGTSDKLWGYLYLGSDDDTLYSFWGRRLGDLTWKRYTDDFSASSPVYVWQKKLKSGYTDVTLADIETVTPGFTDAFELSFVGARLCNDFHGMR